jgi:hypothetical protein
MKRKLNHWNFARILLFVIIGLFNTVFIRPEDIGSWKNYVGYSLLFIAAVEVFFQINQYLNRYRNEK